MTFLECHSSANIVRCWCDDVSMSPLAFYILLLIRAETGDGQCEQNGALFTILQCTAASSIICRVP